MPSLGADMTEGTLLEWLVAPGDRVRRGDVVAVVDTEKAAMDVESFDDGVVERLIATPGTVVPVGGPLAVFAPVGTSVEAPTPAPQPVLQPVGAAVAPAVGAAAPSPLPTQPGPEPAALPARAAPPAKVTPPVRRLAERLGVDLAGVAGTGARGTVTRGDVEAAARRDQPERPVERPLERRVERPVERRVERPVERRGARRPTPSRPRVSPLARRIAADVGVDPATLHGTGGAGAVVADDVRRAALAAAEGRAAPAPPTPGPAEPAAGEGLPVRDAAARSASMRHAIGALMARSKREVPHYYLSTTVDLAAVTALLTARNAELSVSRRLVPAAFLLKAAALAARKVPQVNGFWLDDGFVAAEHVNLGIAVSLRTGGLVAPAILDADRLAVDDVMAALRDLVARSRTGRLRRAEMTEGTLTVTNLGDRGVEAVFGVIYPPQVALVGLGRVVEQPVAVGGLIGVRPVVTATLSGDHRATDGHVGGLYLSALDALLQKPEEL